MKTRAMPLSDFHIEAGASLLDVQERLGHTKIEVTRKYTHNTDILRARTTRILDTLYKDEE